MAKVLSTFRSMRGTEDVPALPIGQLGDVPMLCSRCNLRNSPSNRYCDACGAVLHPSCPFCGHHNRPNAQFCGGCGRTLGRDEPGVSIETVPPALPAPLAALLSSRFAREGERKQVTVLFADIRGSTALIEGLDPEQALQRLEPVLGQMVKAVHHYGGTVSRMLGDGIMALFGAPLAYEDHAVRACFAARAMIEALSALGDAHTDIRVGLNSGEVVVRSIGHDLMMEYDAVGTTVALASRLEQIAAPGSVCMTLRTARLAHGFVDVRRSALVDVKGIARPVEVFELIGTADQTRWQVRASSHALTPFVGRDTELRVLTDALRHMREGRGRIVAVSGAAGMGKSRLVHEFLHSPEVEDLPSLSGAAMPHDRNTPYQLVAQMLRTCLGVETDDSQAAIDDKLVAFIGNLDQPFGHHVTPLRSLLALPFEDPAWDDLDPALRRQQMHEAVRQIVLHIAASQPFILVVEDMHWADFETQSVLDSIVDGLGDVFLLVLVTYRPEYQNGWARYSCYSLVQVGPLERNAADTLLTGLLGDSPELRPLRRRIIEQTDGAPLFLEEMARALVETGVLVSEPTQFRLTQSVDEVEIPDSVQGVLASRIDRLSIEERTLLQIASVIGKEVPTALLRAIASVPPDQFARQLLELRTQEFLLEVSGSSGSEYVFKHALTHAVAYDGMLLRHRRDLHRQLIEAIEQLYADRLDEFIERLADHAMRGEAWDKAALYSFRAGQRANHRSAHRAAATFLRNALAATAHLDRVDLNQAIEIRLALRVAMAATGDLDQVRRYLEEAEELAHSRGDERRLMQILISRSTILNNLGDLDEALRTGLNGRRLAERFEDEASVISSGFALGQAYWNLGQFARAERILTETISAIPRERRTTRTGTTGTASLMCVVSLSHTYSLMGELVPALTKGNEALDMARETERPYDLSYARAALGLAYLTIGDLDAAISQLEEAAEICREHELMLLVPHVARYLGRAYALTGRLEEAERVLVPAVDQTRSQLLGALCGWCSAALGLVRTLQGAETEATTLLREALSFAQQNRYQPLEVHTLRLLGVAAAAKPPHDESHDGAEQTFRCCARLAGELGMRPEEAQSRHGLGDLFLQSGRFEMAQTELRAALEVYRSIGMSHGARSVEVALNTAQAISRPPALTATEAAFRDVNR